MSLAHIAQILPAVVPDRRHSVRTLDDLAREFEEEEALHDDLVISTSVLRLTSDGTLGALGHDDTFVLTDWSRKQLAALVGLASWERWFARTAADDRAAEINKRLSQITSTVCMRTKRPAAHDNAPGTLRALVSHSFAPIPDSALLDLLRFGLQGVEPNLSLVRATRTNRSTTFIIGVGHPFKPGDDHEVGDIWGGISIRNSGVGFAALRIVAGFTRLVCKNGMQAPIPGAVLLRRVHRAFNLGALRDLLSERLRGLPGKLANAGRTLALSRHLRVDDPKIAFLGVLRRARLPQRFLPDLERAYEVEPRLKGTAFGISQAATRAAQSMSPEERFELERAAGEYVTHLIPTDDRRDDTTTTKGELS